MKPPVPLQYTDMEKLKQCLPVLFAFWITGFLLFSVDLSAQILPFNTKSKDWEVWYQKVPVSGGIKVGVIDEFSTDQIDPGSFFVQLPEHDEKYLCAVISSRDGRYKAELNYEIKDLPAGRYEFEWPTAHSSDLQRFTRQELTILCTVGNSCEQDPAYYLITSWKESSPSDTLYVLLNSEPPPMITDENNSEKRFYCERLPASNGIAYNCVCMIPKTAVTENSKWLVVQMVRKPTGRKIIRYPLPIKP